MDYAVGKNREIKRPGLRVKQSHPSSVKTAGNGEADKTSLPEDEMGGCASRQGSQCSLVRDEY